MKFTREAALKIADEEWNKKESFNRGLLLTGEAISALVYDACQKAFEEERERARNTESERDLLQKQYGELHVKLCHSATALDKANRQLKETTEYAIRIREELTIANGIIESRNQEVAELRQELDDMRRRFGDYNLSEDRAIAAWNAFQSTPTEPDPLEALLPSIKSSSLYELSTLQKSVVILIERELARGRKEKA